MIILDFSTQKFDVFDDSIQWQKEIKNFYEIWQSSVPHIIAYTSGSTGKPSAIELPKSAMKLSAQMTGEFFGLTQGKTALLCMPINFIAGKMMLVRAIELKLKLFCLRPQSNLNLDSIHDKIDFAPLTPMQVENSLDSIDKINTLLIGGAPLSDSLRKKLLKKSTKSYESYGMTETITHIALKEISEQYFQVFSRVKIRQDDRNCLVVQTPYFTEEIITNDLVEIKDKSNFKWLGRFDNVINSGGIKLIPEQIENKLKSYIKHDFIISSLPDNILGEKLILIIESEKFNLQLPKGILGKYEFPKEIFFIDKFPRTDSNKVKRKEIIEFLHKIKGKTF